MKQVLRAYCFMRHNTWADSLDAAEFAVNLHKNSSSELSPFEIIYGIQPLTMGVLLSTTAETPAQQLLEEREAVQELVRDNLAKAKAYQKMHADKNKSAEEFQKGDRVRIDTQGLKLSGQPGKALRQRFIGPYIIQEKLSAITYKLKLPPALSAVHPVFHISKLQKWHDDTKDSGRYVSEARGVHADLARGAFEIEKITEVKVGPHIAEPNGDSLLFKVRWANYNSYEDTWEPYHGCGQRGGGLIHTEAVQQFFQTPAWTQFAETDVYKTLRRQYRARVPTPTVLRAVSPGPVTRHITAGSPEAPPVSRSKRGRSGDVGLPQKRKRRQ
jgi:hypothetical protein